MARYFVTRHEGARQWALKHGIKAEEFIEHLDDPTIIRRGDQVMGTLPLHLIEAVLQRGGRYFNLDLEAGRGERGKPMSADDMDKAGAKLVEYFVSHRDEPQPEKDKEKAHRTDLLRRISASVLIILGLFGLAVSTNVAASAFWESLHRIVHTNVYTPGTENWWLLGSAMGLSLLLFAIISFLLYRNRHRILNHSAKISNDPNATARKVLIMGLSSLQNLKSPALANLKSLLEEGVSLQRIAGSRKQIEEESKKDARYADFDKLPWLQNLRAINYHLERLERIFIIPSIESNEPKQKQEFGSLLHSVLEGRKNIAVDWVGEGVNYEDYNAIRWAFEDALKRAHAKKFPDTEISIDVTPGLKPFSIVAASMTFAPGREFLYVSTATGKPLSYDARISLAGGLFGD